MAIARRILDDLRELRWGQVVVELALLVAGILIALAVNGWIEDRRDARVEREYLELLVRDETGQLDKHICQRALHPGHQRPRGCL